MDIAVDSGVSKQPMSDSGSIRGARNRAKAAIKKLSADYGVCIIAALARFIHPNLFEE